MQITMTFRDMDPSPTLEAAAQRWFTRLLHVSPRILSCHATVERPHHHQQHGSPFQIGLVVAVPGATIVVNQQLHVDAHVALADAFRAARRQLLDHADLQQSFTAEPVPGVEVHAAKS
jgi:Sigma 54 modulation protein / S30EA ribosomal protein